MIPEEPAAALEIHVVDDVRELIDEVLSSNTIVRLADVIRLGLDAVLELIS